MKRLLPIVFFMLLLGWFMPKTILAVEGTNNANAACLACHSNQKMQVNKSGQVVNLFVDQTDLSGSVHSGLTCTSCHEVGVPHNNPVYGQELLNQVNAKCITCHFETNKAYQKSVHAQNILQGKDGASCTDCHGTHDIKKSSDTSATTYKLNIPQTCTKCHKGNILESYNYSFHGSAVKLGYEKSATCIDCHNSHDILSPLDPLSTVSKTNQPQTCAKCHLTPQTNFANGNEHLVPQDKDKAFPLWIIWKIFICIILIDVIKDGSIAVLELFRRIRNNSRKSKVDKGE